MKKRDESQYWFKAKRYGWGWGLPANRNGWTVFLVFFGVWLADISWLNSVVTARDTYTPQLGIFLGVMALDVAGLLYFSFKYGEPPKWRWGNKK